MNPKEQQQLLDAIAMLDQFAAQTPVPRPWHVNWQEVYRQVVANVQAIATEKPEKPAGKADYKPIERPGPKALLGTTF